jgi:hypothetical protein
MLKSIHPRLIIPIQRLLETVSSTAPLLIKETEVKDRVNLITCPLPDHLHLISNFKIRSNPEMWLKIDELTHKQGSAYGVVKKVINKNTTKFPWLTRDLLNNYRKKATKQMQLPPLDVNLQKQHGTLISDLTSEVIIETTSSSEGSQSLPEGRPLHLLVGSSLTNSSNDSPESIPARNIGGRPKGATNAAKESRIKRKLEALNEAAVQFMQAKQIDQAKKHGTLKKLLTMLI